MKNANISIPAVDGWQIPAHDVPLPAGASEQLRNSIGATPAPDKASRQEFPANETEWKLAQEQNGKNATQQMTEFANLFQVKVDKTSINEVIVANLTPAKIVSENSNRLFIHVHGGAYVYNGGDNAFGEGIMIAGRLGIPVISIDYRMPPDHPFPAAIDDVVSVYKHLLKSHEPKTMIIGGISSGGGLALASVHKFRQVNLPSPGAVYGGTVWADLTKTSDTLYSNEGLDRILVTYDGSLEAAARLYAGDHDMKDPLISPVYGDFEDYPPTVLVTGTRDLFLSDGVRTHRKLRAAGVDADLHVYEGMSHAEYSFLPDSPESLDMCRE